MRIGIATILITIVLCAESFAGVSISVGFRHHARRAAPNLGIPYQQAQPQYAQPVQPAPQLITPPAPLVIQAPASVTVQTVIPQTTLRWGYFRRRLIPSTTYQLGPMLNYQLQVEGQ